VTGFMVQHDFEWQIQPANHSIPAPMTFPCHSAHTPLDFFNFWHPLPTTLLT